MWKTKIQIHKRLVRKPDFTYPYRDDFKTDGDIKMFCRRKKFSLEITNRVINIIHNGTSESPDYTDNRSMPKSKRIPRSLFVPNSPRGFWDIDRHEHIIEQS